MKTRNLKVLHVASWYPSKERPMAGIFIYRQIQALNTRTSNFVFSVGAKVNSNKIFSYAITKSVSEMRLELGGLLGKAILNCPPLLSFWVSYLVKAKMKCDFDLVHAHVSFPAGYLASVISKDLQKPLIISEHWSGLTKHLDSHLFKSYTRDSLRRASKIIVVSNFLKSLVPQEYQSKTSIIPNIISKNFGVNIGVKQQDSLKKHFVAVASWNDVNRITKRPFLLISALEVLQKEKKLPFEMHFVGGGSLLPKMIRACNEKGIEANFHGPLDSQELSSLMKQCDLLLHASNVETFSVVIAEALVEATPVVASNVGAIPELVNQTNGVLVENTTESWVFGIQAALNSGFDLRRNAKVIKNKLSSSSVSESLETIYSEMVNE